MHWGVGVREEGCVGEREEMRGGAVRERVDENTTTTTTVTTSNIIYISYLVTLLQLYRN